MLLEIDAANQSIELAVHGDNCMSDAQKRAGQLHRLHRERHYGWAAAAGSVYGISVWGDLSGSSNQTFRPAK